MKNKITHSFSFILFIIVLIGCVIYSSLFIIDGYSPFSKETNVFELKTTSKSELLNKKGQLPINNSFGESEDYQYISYNKRPNNKSLVKLGAEDISYRSYIDYNIDLISYCYQDSIDNIIGSLGFKINLGFNDLDKGMILGEFSDTFDKENIEVYNKLLVPYGSDDNYIYCINLNNSKISLTKQDNNKNSEEFSLFGVESWKEYLDSDGNLILLDKYNELYTGNISLFLSFDFAEVVISKNDFHLKGFNLIPNNYLFSLNTTIENKGILVPIHGFTQNDFVQLSIIDNKNRYIISPIEHINMSNSLSFLFKKDNRDNLKDKVIFEQFEIYYNDFINNTDKKVYEFKFDHNILKDFIKLDIDSSKFKEGIYKIRFKYSSNNNFYDYWYQYYFEKEMEVK